jgi:polysaccharide pyruvyl transferase WcaK-like protein
MKKIAVFGEIYSPNVGDGVIYESIEYLFGLREIKTIPCDLSGRLGWEDDIETTNGQPVSLLRKILRIPMRRSRFLRRMYTAMQWFFSKRSKISPTWEAIITSSDGVIVGGGQLLTDLNFGFPPKIYEVARLAKKHNKPMAFFGCGVGSGGWGWMARYLYGFALRYAKYVSCRDEPSAEIIRKYFPHFNIDVHPDPAFIIRQVLRKVTNQKAVNLDSIGFNFQDANHFRSFVPSLRELTDDKYTEFWTSIICSAQDSGYEVSVFTNGDPYDYKFAKAVDFKLKERGREVPLQLRPRRPLELVKTIDSLAVVIATRMHAGIISYALGYQPLAISWDKKVDGVWNSLELGEFVVSAQIFNSNDAWGILEYKLASVKKRSIDKKSIEDTLLCEVGRCCDKLEL